MKKLLIICTLLFSAITFAQAQEGERQMPTPEQRVQRNVDQLTKKLSLTDDQKTKVKAIYTDQMTQQAKLREEAGDDRAAMRTKMMQLMTDTDTKITALLTAEQKTAFEAFKEERRANMGNRGGGGGRPAGQRK